MNQAHIEQLIRSLPPDSEMRSYLERGDRGDGAHYPWMDLMKNLGVQRAKILLDFAWKTHPIDIKVQRIVFFRTYDTNCAQITDPEQLQRIAETELEAQLKEFSIAKTAKSDWTYFEHRPRASHGMGIVEVLDDEWLPVAQANLLPLDDIKPPGIVTDGDVKLLQETLKSHNFSTSELDRALREVAGHLDDECSITPLISAGANPNSQDNDGQTPLMLAAHAGLIHNIAALLNLGADPKIRNVFGEMALDIAERRGQQRIAALLKQSLAPGKKRD